MPKTKWVNNCIELSQNNLSVASVSATFNFNAETAITAGVAEITFPTGFTVSGAGVTAPTGATSTVSGQTLIVSALTWTAGTDNTIVIGTVTNPTTAGGYGPFAITTRHSLTGQIVDTNAIYGSVGIAAAASTLSSLSLAYASGSSGAINASAQSVEFTFTLAKDLWKHDMFVITWDAHF
jgi:hypothetical protein